MAYIYESVLMVVYTEVEWGAFWPNLGSLMELLVGAYL